MKRFAFSLLCVAQWISADPSSAQASDSDAPSGTTTSKTEAGSEEPAAPHAGTDESAPSPRYQKPEGLPPESWEKRRRWWLTVGMLSGTYQDHQANSATGKTQDQTGVKLSGFRVRGDANLMGYGFVGAELRQCKTSFKLWETHRHMAVGLHAVLPFLHVIAPGVGFILQSNTIKTSHRDSQLVSMTDVQAYYLGLWFSQRVWGINERVSILVRGNIQSMNPGMSDGSGIEWELDLGAAWKFRSIRFDTTLGYLRHTYAAEQVDDTVDPPTVLGFSSVTSYFLGQATIWI